MEEEAAEVLAEEEARWEKEADEEAEEWLRAKRAKRNARIE